MPTAYIDAAKLHFPDRCAPCGRPAETTHEIDACRGIDLLFIAAWEFFPIPVPVCRLCKRKRRARGIALYAGGSVFIFIAGFVALQLIFAELKIAAGVLFAMLVAFSLAVRFRGDAFLEWTTTGLVVDVLRGRGTPLRLKFRDPQFFTAWRRVNPDAASSRQQLLTAESAMATTARASNAPHRQFTRATPAICLVAITLLLALHHWWVVTQGEMYTVFMLFLFMFGGMAAGGTLYPPLFYAVGKYGTHLPLPIRLLGGAFAIAGIGLGFYVMLTMYQVNT